MKIKNYLEFGFLEIGHSRRGSILIWTVLLGFMLTSIVFFFSVRLRDNSGLERDTMFYKNQKTYLESYVNYLESLDDTELDGLKGTLDFDGIKGILDNEFFEVEGFLDSGDSVTYEFVSAPALAATTSITIEWNLCSENHNGNLVLTHADGTGIHYSGSSTTCDEEYKNKINSNINTSDTNKSFTIQALDSPFYYKINSTDGTTKIIDKKWHITAYIDGGYGKKIKIEEVF